MSNIDDLDILDEIDIRDAVAIDYLDDIDIDIRNAVAEEFDEKTYEELDDINIREALKERTRSPEELYAIEVYKLEREFRELRRKLHRYIDNDGVAYYGKSNLSLFGGIVSLLLIAVFGFLLYKDFDGTVKTGYALGFLISLVPVVITKLIDNIRIKKEHKLRDEKRFEELNKLREELGLPKMVGKEVFLNGKKPKLGLSLMLWSLFIVVFLALRNFVITLAEAGVLVGVTFLILCIYHIVWCVRRGKSVKSAEVDDAQIGYCVTKTSKMGYNGKVHRNGTFRIDFDGAVVELSSPYVSRRVEPGVNCRYYSIQGLFETRIRYYFGVRPPTSDMIVSNLLKFIIKFVILTVLLMLGMEYFDEIISYVRSFIQL